ncbi:hypothetical protein D3C87_1137930 [compost metagenome]
MRIGGGEVRQRLRARLRRELGQLAGAGTGLAGAVDQRHGVRVEVVRRRAGALVGVGHGTATLEAPFADRNPAVDAARARRGGRDQARIGGVEIGRDLRHDRHVLLAGAIVGKGDVLGTGHLALAGRDVALGIHVRPVQRAVATQRVGIDDGAVVIEDGDAAQLGRRGRGGIGRHRRGGRGDQAVLAESGSQQVVGIAVVVLHADGAHHESRPVVRVLRRGAAAAPAVVIVIPAAAGANQQHRHGGGDGGLASWID